MPLPTSGMSDTDGLAARGDLDGDRLERLARGERLRLAARRPPACSSGLEASPAIATTAGVAPPGKASLTRLNDCIALSDLGRASRPEIAVCRDRAGSASTTSTSRGSDRRDERPSEDAVEDRRPEPALAVVALEPPEERHARLVDPVAEPRQHRREDGQRADHRDGDDHHRPDREGHERLVAGEEHPGHRDHDRDPRREDGAARGCCGCLECGRLAAPGPSLVTLAADVEERVVDADGESDEEDDLRDRLVHGDDLARQGDEPHRREHGREREEERDRRADERAEDEQQDAERQRDREQPGPGELRARTSRRAPCPVDAEPASPT